MSPDLVSLSVNDNLIRKMLIINNFNPKIEFENSKQRNLRYSTVKYINKSEIFDERYNSNILFDK